MRKARSWVLGILVTLCLLWLGTGALVWSRNRVPALALPPPEKMPAGNVYESYLKCVTGVPPADKQMVREYNAFRPLPAEKKQELLARNRALLARFHELPGHPCTVTERETKANFVAALDFP